MIERSVAIWPSLQIASETGKVAHGKDVRAIPHGKETHRAHKINACR